MASPPKVVESAARAHTAKKECLVLGTIAIGFDGTLVRIVFTIYNNTFSWQQHRRYLANSLQVIVDNPERALCLSNTAGLKAPLALRAKETVGKCTGVRILLCFGLHLVCYLSSAWGLLPPSLAVDMCVSAVY